MRMLVVGAGSTGGYFGGRLAQAGRDVTFLVRPARAAQLEERGLEILSPHGDFTLPPETGHRRPVIRALRCHIALGEGFSLESALSDMAGAVGPETMILPVLNGMRHVDILADSLARDPSSGCACKITASIDDRGRIVQHNLLQDISYGEMDGVVSPRIQGLDRFMRDAGFDARLVNDIKREDVGEVDPARRPRRINC